MDVRQTQAGPSHSAPTAPRWRAACLFALALLALSACQRSAAPSPASRPLARELVFYDWAEDMPQSVLDAFQKEYGVMVKYLTYEAQEEAMANLRAGKVYDVLVMESRHVPLLAREGRLAPIDYRNVPNQKNLSANFRDLVADPGNRHSVPYNWGVTGLVVRSDLVGKPPERWADLWDPRCRGRGRVGLWLGQPRDLIALTLKSLGYSANSEVPAELEAAVRRLLELKPHVLALEKLPVDAMGTGKVSLCVGYAEDVVRARKTGKPVAFVLPGEGALMWHDTFTIPVTSANKYTAEVFLNFLLRPEVAARIANENSFATPNEAALPLVDPAIRNDPVIYPPQEALKNAEVILPLSPEGVRLYDDLWRRFQAGRP